MDVATLRGKGAIVAGAGSGINLAFAKALHSAGCSVLIMDIGLHRDATTWIDSIVEPSDSSLAKVEFYKASVTDWTALRKVFDLYDEKFGGVPYIVCPGAGIYEPSHSGFWKDEDVENHYKVLDVNLLHPIKMTRIAIRRMLSSNSLGTSKHGISGFIRCMADLYKLAGIKVVGVAPGIIKTPLYFDHPEAKKFLAEEDFALDPEEVARGMVAVCLDHKYPTGTILEVADPDRWREVQLLNDPGPQGRAILASRKQDAVAGVLALIQKDSHASNKL